MPLWALRGKAFFTKEIDRALLAGEVDLAVHSLKDLSTLLERGMELAATLTREDPRDALLSRTGATLAALDAALDVPRLPTRQGGGARAKAQWAATGAQASPSIMNR